MSEGGQHQSAPQGRSSGSARRAANNLVAMSSPAVLALYAAGYLRTRAAADKLEAAGRRVAIEPPPVHDEPPQRTESKPAHTVADQPAIGFAISPAPSSHPAM